MSDEEKTKQQTTSMDQLFDDDDDSDEDDDAMNTTNNDNDNNNNDVDNNNSSNSNNNNNNSGNNALFGSDESDDDDDDDNVGTTGGTNTETGGTTEDAGGDNDGDGNGEGNANGNTGGNDEDDDDAEFKDDNIVGKARKVIPPTDDKKVVKKQNLEVPDYPLPQFQSEGNENGNRKDKTFHMTQLPKQILNIQSEPFSKSKYNANVERKEYKERVANMIRWRYKTLKENGISNGVEKIERDEVTGKAKKESNARIIKWSDGSYGLRVGKEIFDIDEVPYKGTTTKPKQPALTSKVTSKDFIYLTQKASAATSTEYDDGDDDDKPTTTILQAVTSLKSKFIPRPSSLHSEAHRQAALESRSRTMKRAKIAEYVSFEDPEKQKLERIRNKDDLMKQQSRSGGRKSYSNNAGRRRVGMNRGYMEDDEYDNVNIRRLKKSTMDEDDMDYGDDDIQSDDDEWSKRKKRGFEQSRKNKKTTRSKNRFDESDESDESDEDEFDDDDDEEDFVAVRKRGTSDSAKKRKAGIFDDDDDSDE